MNDILACPFCGGPATVFLDDPNSDMQIWSVVCDGCDSEGPPAWHKDKAIEKWNRRAALEEANKECDESRAERGEIEELSDVERQEMGLPASRAMLVYLLREAYELAKESDSGDRAMLHHIRDALKREES